MPICLIIYLKKYKLYTVLTDPELGNTLLSHIHLKHSWTHKYAQARQWEGGCGSLHVFKIEWSIVDVQIQELVSSEVAHPAKKKPVIPVNTHRHTKTQRNTCQTDWKPRDLYIPEKDFMQRQHCQHAWTNMHTHMLIYCHLHQNRHFHCWKFTL